MGIVFEKQVEGKNKVFFAGFETGQTGIQLCTEIDAEIEEQYKESKEIISNLADEDITHNNDHKEELKRMELNDHGISGIGLQDKIKNLEQSIVKMQHNDDYPIDDTSLDADDIIQRAEKISLTYPQIQDQLNDYIQVSKNKEKAKKILLAKIHFYENQLFLLQMQIEKEKQNQSFQKMKKISYPD